MRRSTLILMVLLGCGDDAATPADPTPTDPNAPAEDEDSLPSADVIESSLEELGKASTDVVALATAGARSSVVEECVPTFGSCELCYRLEGSPRAGEIGAVTDPPGCGETFTGTYGSAAYTVQGSEFFGTWTENDDGTYTVSLTGYRDGTIALAGDGPGDAGFEVDSSWTLDALEVVVTPDLEIVSYYAVLTYERPVVGTSATLEVTGDAASITGTVTADDGSCTVTGTADDIDVDCEAA
jgi:hypothetical protein